jgi:hypothetical protein
VHVNRDCSTFGGMGLQATVGLGSVDTAEPGAADGAELMRFSHAEPDKVSFVDAVAATYVLGIEMVVRPCC